MTPQERTMDIILRLAERQETDLGGVADVICRAITDAEKDALERAGVTDAGVIELPPTRLWLR